MFWFTHLETKAPSQDGEEKGVFFVCAVRGRFIPEAAWKGLQKMKRGSLLEERPLSKLAAIQQVCSTLHKCCGKKGKSVVRFGVFTGPPRDT